MTSRSPFAVSHDPVEEVAFDRAGDARARELLAREKLCGVVLLNSENGERHAFGYDDEIGVLKPKRVVLDVSPIDDLEELRPQLPLEEMGGDVLQPVPQRAKSDLGLAEGDRVGAELNAHCLRVRWQRNFERERAVEPRKELAGFVGIKDRLLDHDELSAVQSEHAPQASVGRDADEWLAGLGLAVRQIVRHLALDIGPFAQEVALGFEDRPADQGVGAALDLDALLETDVSQRNVEL